MVFYRTLEICKKMSLKPLKKILVCGKLYIDCKASVETNIICFLFR